ncbi:hypothetical protein AXG93_1467s1340 [Marchantia polymorpha subsp. ruderalis]|uniref:Uncharacterized protein n=1 Tax=Marchantia polymorpha subsp. ruderalis TaxID=1480154 RepID=A0A176WML3_MARPO|nr:hypothetical protein AXG93_1467s1340 [Marchantia polymorpha subsp. ruderalis]
MRAMFSVKDKDMAVGNEVPLIEAQQTDFQVKADFARPNYQIVYRLPQSLQRHELLFAYIPSFQPIYHILSRIPSVAKKHFSITSSMTGKNNYGVTGSPNVDQAFIAVIITIIELAFGSPVQHWFVAFDAISSLTPGTTVNRELNLLEPNLSQSSDHVTVTRGPSFNSCAPLDVAHSEKGSI